MHLPPDIIVKLLLSIVIGGLIGAEREYRSKSAGFRTLTLICLGSALFTIFSQLTLNVLWPSYWRTMIEEVVGDAVDARSLPRPRGEGD